LWLLSLRICKGKVNGKVVRDARSPRFWGEKYYWGHPPGRSEKCLRILEGKIAGLLDCWIAGIPVVNM
jgi:hypothetical protein